MNDEASSSSTGRIERLARLLLLTCVLTGCLHTVQVQAQAKTADEINNLIDTAYKRGKADGYAEGRKADCDCSKNGTTHQLPGLTVRLTPRERGPGGVTHKEIEKFLTVTPSGLVHIDVTREGGTAKAVTTPIPWAALGTMFGNVGAATATSPVDQDVARILTDNLKQAGAIK
jgi:hypothetical protein